MFERNPLAVKKQFHNRNWQFWTVRRRGSIADNFDVCNWRPDSETVASRVFAHASSEN